MKIVKQFIQYCLAMTHQVAGYLTGGIAAAAISVYEHYSKGSVSWHFVEVSLVTFYIASSFSIWRKQRDLIENANLSADAYPDWAIRELFFHLSPNVTDTNPNLWEKVGDEVRDKLSTGQLRVWGREINPHTGARSPLTEVNSQYWVNAVFSYSFLAENHEHSNHTFPPKGWVHPEYCDLQVNKTQALSIWPSRIA